MITILIFVESEEDGVILMRYANYIMQNNEQTFKSSSGRYLSN